MFFLEVMLAFNRELDWKPVTIITGLVSAIEALCSSVPKDNIFDNLVPASANMRRI